MLAIEHDWRLRKLIRANLGALGIEVQEAFSGQHGLQILCHSTPDLILVDLDMPGVDTMHLLRALHAQLRGRPVPIIVISADPLSRGVIEQGYVASYLQKPFAASALLEQVQRALGGSIEN
jgi:CheY-like chemotaxis protein